MKKIFFIALLFTFCSSELFAQISIGLLSGTNYSDLHGINQDNSNFRWKTKSGPVSGLYFSYDLNKYWGFTSEFDYATLYYERVSESVLYNDFDNIGFPYTDKLNFEYNFYRLPVYFKFSVPTRLKFETSIGAYISYLESYDKAPLVIESDPPAIDWGYFYSVGISYNISNHFSMFLNGRYITGRKKYEMISDSRLASYEIIMGISYSGLFEQKSKPKQEHIADTVENKRFIRYKAGFNYSWIKTNQHFNNYSAVKSLSFGVSLKFMLNKNTAFITELLYERKGYNYNDSSSLNFRYYNVGSYKEVSTKTDFDYIVIPFLLNKEFGNKYTFYLNTGPYVGFVLDAKNHGETWSEYRDYGYYSLDKSIVYENIEDEIESYDWGWVFGGGVQYPVFDKLKLDIEVRYNFGLKNILNELDSEEFNNDYFNNRSLGFFIGLQIPFI